MAGLKGEKVAWSESLKKLRSDSKSITGDIFMTACALAYMSPFPKLYRNNKFRPKVLKLLKKAMIITQKEATLTDIIGDPITIGIWCNLFTLPADDFSIENAVMIDNCTAWPLLIDPQL